MAFSRICHARERARTESFWANSAPRLRSVSLSDGSAAASGTIFRRVTRWVKLARSEITTAGSAPAGIVLRPQFSEGGGYCAAHHRFEQVDHPGPVGEASMSRRPAP